MSTKKDTLKIERGDLVWVKLEENPMGSEQGGVRPAIVIQNNRGNKNAPTTIVVFLTSKIKTSLPVHVRIATDALDSSSTALCEQIRTIDKRRITGKICKLDDDSMKKLRAALMLSLDL